MRKAAFPTLDHVWLAAALLLVALRPLVIPIPPQDFWWHMATGRLIIQEGAIPAVDTFSYTQAGTPFYNQGWLAQVLLYGLYNLGGVHLILVVQSAVITLAYGLLLWLCIRRSGAVRLSVAVLLLTLPLVFDNWNVRPQSYAFPLFMGFLFILTSWRTGHSQGRHGLLWLLPLLMALWVNIHGSFVLGGVLVAMTFGGEAVRRLFSRPPPDAEASAAPPLRVLFFWSALTAAALLLNPRHIEVVAYVRDLLSTSTVTDLVTEWAPPTTRELTGRIFFLTAMVSVLILSYARRPPDPIDMLLVGAFFWLALSAERHIVWFGMLLAPLLATQAASLVAPREGAPRRSAAGLPAMNAALIGLLGLLLLLGLPWVKPHLGLPPEIGRLIAAETPVAAVEHLRDTPEPARPERLFHTMGAGSYLIWAAPEQPVFIDTRIELYPLEQWRDYIALNAGRNVEELLADYHIDGLLLNNEQQAALLEYVEAAPAWEVRYRDEWHTYLAPAE
jgi:hypothetical protein